jgi:hypothetical protein
MELKLNVKGLAGRGAADTTRNGVRGGDEDRTVLGRNGNVEGERAEYWCVDTGTLCVSWRSSVGLAGST